MANKVAENEEIAVALVDSSLFEQDAGAGMAMEQDDLALPFLKVLSDWTP